jgi:hypothetical protein
MDPDPDPRTPGKLIRIPDLDPAKLYGPLRIRIATLVVTDRNFSSVVYDRSPQFPDYY